MSTKTAKSDELFSVLLEMFGTTHLELINRAIDLSRRDTGIPSAEAAIENMFELINKESDDNMETEPPTADSTKSFANLAGAMPTTSNLVQPHEITGNTGKTNYLPDNFSKVTDMIGKGYKVLILLRGLPGSGKSYLGKEIISKFGFDARNHIFSADDFFVDAYGRYNYDVNRLSQAHDFNQNRCFKKMREGWSPIIVDNTSLKQWEMFPYVKFAVKYHYLIEILEPVTPWAMNASQLEARNQHKVPKEKIRKMMNNYERTSVQKLLQILDCESHISLEPALRHYPSFTKDFIQQNKEYFPEMQDDAALSSKPQREKFDGHTLPSLLNVPSSSTSTCQQDVNWQAFEEDTFWNKYDKNTPKQNTTKPKVQKEISTEPKPPRDNLLKSLKEATVEMTTKKKESPARDLPSLEKHKKDCPNENKTFREIRLMFPMIGTGYLFDLFVKCGGDGEWVTDILCQDEMALNYEAQTNDGLDCDCGKPTPSEFSKQLSSPKISHSNKVLAKPGTSSRNSNNNKKTENLEATKRLIEGQFVINDKHYSSHMKKIRDIRHPNQAVAAAATTPDIPDSNSETPSEAEDEIVEINLSIELVQQLEQMFGGNELNVENGNLVFGDLKLKPKVFMNRSLANQMYAMWCESLYNQLEEQRQTAVRCDLELARQLDAQEKYPGLFKKDPPKDLKDIIDIEMSLAAYKQDISKWKDQVPNNMATRLARDKLRVIFPNLDHDILDEMLAAHKNDVNETISVLRATVNNDTDLIARRSKELFAQAQAEINELSEGYQDFERDEDDNNFNYKLDPEDTKRAAIREFEECRNVAQHHAQLKAECYSKARNAIQRNEHSVALYYSQIADLHKTKIDFFNHKAANCLMEAHNLSQNSKNMLDLHYLHSSEAIQCLDMFVDKHIHILKMCGRPYKNVFVITGRGVHSINGIPAIKIRVKARLKDRDLKFSEVNPGLLRIKLLQNSKFASDAS